MNILTTLQQPLGQDSIYYVHLNSKSTDMLSKKCTSLLLDLYSNIATQSGIIPLQKVKKQLEVVHNEAARIITGATKLCSINNLLADLGWETLQSKKISNDQELIQSDPIFTSQTSEVQARNSL